MGALVINMSNELCMLGTRHITINKTGKQEVQTYECYPTNFNEEINQLIINSDSPIVEWCKQVRKTHAYRAPIYIWDLEENKDNPQMIQKEEAYFLADSIYNYENPNPEDIVGYKRSLAEDLIADTYVEMAELLDNDYDITWIIK